MIEFVAYALLLIFPLIVVMAALSDCTSFTIPNWTSAILVIGFPVAALTAGVPSALIGICLLTGLAGLVIGMAMFAAGWIGGGDAKLFAASFLWLGMTGAIPFLVITAISGGALAVGLVGLRSERMSPIFAIGPAWLSRLTTRGESVPYGIAIAIGALAAFPQSPITERVLTAF